MSAIIKKAEGNANLETLVLDGIKLSGCSSLRDLLGKHVNNVLLEILLSVKIWTTKSWF